MLSAQRDSSPAPAEDRAERRNQDEQDGRCGSFTDSRRDPRVRFISLADPHILRLIMTLSLCLGARLIDLLGTGAGATRFSGTSRFEKGVTRNILAARYFAVRVDIALGVDSAQISVGTLVAFERAPCAVAS